MGIESEAHEDLALTADDAANVVGGAKKRSKKTAAPTQHAVTHAEPRMIVMPGFGPAGNEGVLADVPVDPDTGY